VTFFVKKFISQFLMPIPLIMLLYLGGWLLFRFTAYKKMGRVLIASAAICFVLFGYGAGAERYLYRLERMYVPVELNAEGVGKYLGAAIVVLGQGLPEHSDLPLRFQTSSSFQMRLQEGARLNKMIPQSQLVVSLAGEVDVAIKQQYLDCYAKDHGLARDRMHLISEARDTSEEARLALDCVKTNNLFLVTSASHLPRAVKIFTQEINRRKMPMKLAGTKGCERDCGNGEKRLLVPVPCDYTSVATNQYSFHIWDLPLPSINGFSTAQHAWYEWLGNMYEDLRK